MGGVDLHDASGSVLDALRGCILPQTNRISVAMGSMAPSMDSVRARAAAMPWVTDVLVGVSEMAELMADCDLAIGAPGGSAWERCCLGLPTVLVVLAENQRAGARALATAGAAVLLGGPEAVDTELAVVLDQLAKPGALQELSRRCAGLTDGRGVDRVMAEMVAIDG